MNLEECKIQCALGLWRRTFHRIVVLNMLRNGKNRIVAMYRMTLYSPFYPDRFYDDQIVTLPEGVDLFDNWLEASLVKKSVKKLNKISTHWYSSFYSVESSDPAYRGAFIIYADDETFKILRKSRQV